MADWSLLKSTSGTSFLSSISNYSNHGQALSQLQMSSFIDNHNYTTGTIYDENTFCTQDNIDECITHLNQVSKSKSCIFSHIMLFSTHCFSYTVIVAFL